MIRNLADVGGVGGKRGVLRRRLYRAERDAVELGDTLGDDVDVLVELGAQIIEQQVHGDEVGPLMFQCACLVINARSIASARRALQRSTMARLALEAISTAAWAGRAAVLADAILTTAGLAVVAGFLTAGDLVAALAMMLPSGRNARVTLLCGRRFAAAGGLIAGCGRGSV
jgi:hypothetical protein